jgi:hypothetical protein
MRLLIVMLASSPFCLVVLYVAVVFNAVSTLLRFTASGISYVFCQLAYVVEMKTFREFLFLKTEAG